ncbi:MAG: hypothetical protein KDC87_05710 [Planctomycetes bacterium]|nr:hypothetical protein [Planctomycetota bacterium]MCB9872414.1 hypothetical protein [Planctomycetota bacterium]MCB9888951.1 hypothetical protein [Planctomycetota bacterium]
MNRSWHDTDRPVGRCRSAGKAAPRAWLACATAWVLSASFGGGLAAQPTAKPDHGDPYGSADQTVQTRLGYESFGPFVWGTGYGTDHIRRTLGAANLLFVETRHFKLGVDLAPRSIPNETRFRRKIVAELETLRKKLRAVDPRSRKLDRWLLLHLHAQRLEQLYTDFAAALGVRDVDFPSLNGARTPGKFMGKGPHLGQRGKFCVILFDQRTQLERYTGAYAGKKVKVGRPLRHVLHGGDSLGFATASECFGGRLYDDVAMHAHVAGMVAQCLADGYKATHGVLPTWWIEGLGHYHRRRVEPRFDLWSDTADPEAAGANDWDWMTKVAARVRFAHYPLATKLYAERDSSAWKLQLHMMSWSRVDFLLHKDPDGMRRFLDYLNDHPVPFTRVSPDAAARWQSAAIRHAWGLDSEAFDREWKGFVERTYGK